MNFIKKLGNLSSKMKWLMFSNKRDYTNDSQLFKYISDDLNEKIELDTTRLENMVKESLRREFGQSIENSKSYGLLVDAVVHNIKKKQLEEENFNIEEELEK